MAPSGRFTHVIVILMFGTGYMQVMYLGRAPHTKETLPDFREKCRITRHSRVFRGLTSSQRTPRFWGVTDCENIKKLFENKNSSKLSTKRWIKFQNTLIGFKPKFEHIKGKDNILAD